MKIVFSRLWIYSFFIFIAFGWQISASAQIPQRIPVLIELFTSEGCVRCPPAEQNLAFLEKEQPFKQAEIIALALHVDYWDMDGWKDKYSSPVFTQRQKIYSQKFKIYDLFTPQMVVDGAEQFNGTDLAKLQKAVIESSKRAKAKIELSIEKDKLKAKISALTAQENATVFLAVAESGLSRKVFRVGIDEKNSTHSSVVRELKFLGSVAPGVQSFESVAVLPLQPEWNQKNLKYAVFIQENQSRKILGVNILKDYF